jgi:hypothetical protein
MRAKKALTFEELQAERQKIKEKDGAIRAAFKMNPAPPELKEE